MHMNFQLFIGDNLILHGDIFIVSIIILVLLIILTYVIWIIWKKLRANETLKYEFVTIIAHKFRTPLTQIKWILETIFKDEIDPYKKESLSNISKSNETLINLTNSLVDITDSVHSSKSSYNFQRINVCEMVNRVSNSLKERFHEKNIFFGIQCSNPNIFVRADSARIDFVLQTLIENSINYSHAGGSVDIKVDIHKRKVAVSVIDRGIGIDQAEFSRLFTKFFRSSSAKTMDTDGFGVGLYLAKSVVKRHGGKLEAFSEGLEKGTTFTMTLHTVA
jgi:two-component system phosphate regulon sensor histidine kinase PhoR